MKTEMNKKSKKKNENPAKKDVGKNYGFSFDQGH